MTGVYASSCIHVEWLHSCLGACLVFISARPYSRHPEICLDLCARFRSELMKMAWISPSPFAPRPRADAALSAVTDGVSPEDQLDVIPVGSGY